MDREAILRQFGYFKGISSKSRKLLAGICLSRIYRKNETVFREGEKGYALYLCINGRIQLFKRTGEGKEVVIKVIEAGEIFGEVVLFELDLYPVTALALIRSQIFLLPKHQFLCLLEHEDFRNDFIKVLMSKQRYLANQIKYLTTYDVEDRLYLYLYDHYGDRDLIKPSISKKSLAMAIGTTPETLSRVLLRLRDSGLLSWHGNVIKVSMEFWSRGERISS